MQGRTWSRAATAGIVLAVTALAAVGMGAAAPAARALGDTPRVLGQWRFDEASGQDALDDGPFGLDGRLGATEGTDTTDPERVAGLRGRALRFGGGGYVRLPVAGELAPPTISLEAVVRGDQSPGRFRYLIAHGAKGCIAGSYGLYTGDAGGIAFYVYDGHHFVISAGAEPADVWNGGWHHVAGVFSGSALRLYVDGRPVGDPQPAPLTIAYELTSIDTYFGLYRGTCSLPLRGDVDLVRMWNAALGPASVARLADAALTPAQDPVTPPPGDDVPTAEPPAVDPPDGPSSRPPLPAATSGTTSPGPKVSSSSPTPTAAPGAPPRACVITPARTRLHVHRTTVLSVRVSVRRRPLRRAVVVATQPSARRVIGRARTASNGRARLKLRPWRRGVVRITVKGRRDCTTASVKVVRR